jgi:PAS domain S-box-containing protein
MTSAEVGRRVWSSPVLRFAAGSVLSLAAGFLRDAAVPVIGDRAPFALFYPVVVIASLLGGVASGFGALLAAIAHAVTRSPYGRLEEVAGADWLILAVFTALSTFLILAVDALRRTRREAQDANRRARHSEQILDETLRTAKIGHWTWHLETGRVVWSENLEEIHGLARGSFDGRFASFLERVHPEDRPRLQAAIDRAVQDRVGYDVDFRFQKPEGGIEWINGRGRPLVEDGRVIALTGLATNVTAARAAGHDLGRLAAIVGSSDDAIVSKDLNGRITSWNVAAERLFGYPAEEVLGQSIEKLLPAERSEDFFSILDRIRRGQRVEHYETLRRRKDGSTIEVELTVSPILDENGQIVGASKIARDLTARRAAEREQERTRELLLGTLGHDLRNPLNTIVASAYYLQKRVPEPLEHVVRRITAASDRMVGLIDQLLDFARARLGEGIVPELREVDLSRVAGAVVDEIEAQHPGRVRLSAAGELVGHWDPDRLAQVFANLIGNALRHGSRQDPVDVRLTTDGSGTRVDVTNRGQPIPAHLHEAIFEPFRRVPTTGGDRGGLGLGLYIAREIVRAHGGSIALRSEEEQTTFSVLLPAAARPSEPPGSLREEAASAPSSQSPARKRLPEGTAQR